MVATECGLDRPELGETMTDYRVLCVDDNRDCADSTAMLLQLMGFETEACYDSTLAIHANDTFQPEVCFIDLNMPQMDGDVLARKLRTWNHWQPKLLIAITAMSNDASTARIAAAGFDMHLVKPVGPEDFEEAVATIRRVLESYPVLRDSQ